MALYFFDFSYTGTDYPDTEGTELASFEAVKDEAVRSIVEMTIEVLPDGSYRELTFKVRDETGRQLMQVGIRFELTTDPPN